MTKGHNKGVNNRQSEHKGGDEHLKDKKRSKDLPKGRSKENDPAGGKKGKNSV